MDLHETVARRRRHRRHRERVQRDPLGQAEADGHRAEVAPPDGRRRPAGDDLVAEEDGGPVRQRLHLVHVVRRQQHRRPGRGQQPDELPRLTTPRGVEARRGLVEEEEVRVADDPQAHIEPSLLAARQPLDAVVALLLQTDELDHLVDRTRVGVVAGIARQDLAHRVVGLDGQLLEHHADARAEPALGAVVGRIDAERLDPPAGPLAEALEDLDGGGLAGAVRPEQREHLALLHLEAHVAHSHVLAVGLGEVLHAHCGHGHPVLPLGESSEPARRRSTGTTSGSTIGPTVSGGGIRRPPRRSAPA